MYVGSVNACQGSVEIWEHLGVFSQGIHGQGYSTWSLALQLVTSAGQLVVYRPLAATLKSETQSCNNAV